MILHSGASMHGHEYSDPQPSSQPPPRCFPFLRSALRPRSDTDPIARQSSPVSSLNGPADARPTRPLSLNEPPRPSSLSNRRRTISDATPHTVRFREPHTDIVQASLPSEDEESLVGSELSDQTDASGRQKRRKRAPRKSTRFALAHPAPQLRTKQRNFLQIRPRVLLQLQELGEKRAIPAFDVVPSSLIAGTLIIPKLSRRFPRMFRAKPYLGQNDLLLVRSEDYGPSSGSSQAADGADNSLDHKEVLAVVSTTTKQDDDCVEIVFQDGSMWITSPMANGSYEFTHIDDQGQIVKARWVKRAQSSPRASWASANTTATVTATSTSTPPPEHRWTFSIIDPSTRRHPIQGILTPATLDIFDTYNTMSKSSGRYPPTRSFGSDISSIVEESPLPNSIPEERTAMAVTEEHKTLMLATAIWISLRQKDWPASAAPKMQRVVSQCRSGRSYTFPIGCGGSDAATPQASLPNSRNISQDTLATHRHPNAGMLRRAVSSGSEFMRRRREASGLVEEQVDEKRNPKLKVKVKAEEETHTCRLTVRRLTSKLFHHPKSPRVS